MEEKKYSTAFSSKELTDTVQTFEDYCKLPPSLSDAGSSYIYSRELWKCHL